MLKQQIQFLSGLHFNSEFGRAFYGDEAIRSKLRETQGLLEILKS
jgi:hypothetical protein